jgi:hypothetical protein
MGPPEYLNRLKRMCTPRTDLRTHRTATPRKHTPSGAYMGSADPRISRTALGLVDPGLPRGACPLVLEAIPEVFHSFLCWCSGIYIEGEGLISYQHILLLHSHFWFLRLGGRLE